MGYNTIVIDMYLLTIPKITLASESPRRKDILTQMHIPFDSIAPNIKETSDHTSPSDIVCDIACAKALSIKSKAKTTLVLAADTLVVLNNVLYGKAKNQRDAERMLAALSGNTHTVYSGVCVLHIPSNTITTRCASAQVTFAVITSKELHQYLQSTEWQGVAGAYRIQGLGACFIKNIVGEYSTIMGLPIRMLYDILRTY